MTIAAGNKLTVTATGQTGYLKLKKGINKLFVSTTSWSTSSLTLRTSPDGTDAKGSDVKNGPNGDTVTISTANQSLIVYGPGYLGANVTAYGGTAVEIELQDG